MRTHEHLTRAIFAASAILAATAARADFWQGNADYSYSDSGTFEVTQVGSISSELVIQTYSGPFIIGLTAGSGEWSAYVSDRLRLPPFGPPTAPPPWETRDVVRDMDGFYTAFYTEGVPGTQPLPSPELAVADIDTLTLGSYSHQYRVKLGIQGNFSYDGADRWTIAGTWDYSAILIDRNGTPPVPLSVPDGGATLTLLGLSAFGLALARKFPLPTKAPSRGPTSAAKMTPRSNNSLAGSISSTS